MEKHDIVALLDEKSYNSKKLEITYLVKSIRKFCKWCDKIYIIGSVPPASISDQVIHLSCDNPYTHEKDANIIHRIRYAIENIPDLSDDFVFCADDNMFIKETNFEDIVPMRRDMPPAKFPRTGWFMNLRKTMSRFNTTIWIEPHMPMVMNKEKFINMCESINYKKEKGVSVMTLYNSFNHIESIPLDDRFVFVRYMPKINPNTKYIGYYNGSMGNCAFAEFVRCILNDEDYSHIYKLNKITKSQKYSESY